MHVHPCIHHFHVPGLDGPNLSVLHWVGGPGYEHVVWVDNPGAQTSIIVHVTDHCRLGMYDCFLNEIQYIYAYMCIYPHMNHTIILTMRIRIHDAYGCRCWCCWPWVQHALPLASWHSSWPTMYSTSRQRKGHDPLCVVTGGRGICCCLDISCFSGYEHRFALMPTPTRLFLCLCMCMCYRRIYIAI